MHSQNYNLEAYFENQSCTSFSILILNYYFFGEMKRRNYPCLFNHNFKIAPALYICTLTVNRCDWSAMWVGDIFSTNDLGELLEGPTAAVGNQVVLVRGE